LVEKHPLKQSRAAKCTTRARDCQQRECFTFQGCVCRNFRGYQKSVSAHTLSILFKHVLAALGSCITDVPAPANELVFVLINNCARGGKNQQVCNFFAIPLPPASVRIYVFYGLGVHPDRPVKGKITHSTRAR
jgi:hypothetical protein